MFVITRNVIESGEGVGVVGRAPHLGDSRIEIKEKKQSVVPVTSKGTSVPVPAQASNPPATTQVEFVKEWSWAQRFLGSLAGLGHDIQGVRPSSESQASLRAFKLFQLLQCVSVNLRV